MTMNTSRRTIAAGRFKAECLGILDQVAKTGEVVIVTKRGRPVAKLVPVEQADTPSLLNSVTFYGDIVEPIGDTWEADQ